MPATRRFAPAAGLLVEALGDGWVAFSPLSGDTIFLNDQSAAIIEVLSERAADASAVCHALSADTGLTVEELSDLVSQSCTQLVDGGLIVELT